MPITAEETAATVEAIEAGTPLADIPALAELGGAVVIRTTQQDTDYKTGIIETEVEDKIKTRVGEIHGQYDEQIEKFTGQKRPSDVKTYTHLDSVFEEHKTKVTELQGSLDTLKAAGGDTTKLQEKHDQSVKDLETGFQTRLDAKEKEFTDFKAKTELGTHETSIRSVISTVEARLIPKEKLPPMFDKTLGFIKSHVIGNSRIDEDGIAIMLDEHGNDARDTNMRKIPVENYLNGELKDVLQQTKPASGTGDKPGEGGGGGLSEEELKEFKSIESVSIPEGIKSKLQLTAHIEKELKLTSRDEKFSLIMRKFGANLPLR